MAGFILPFIAANAARNQQRQQGGPMPNPDETLIGSALGRYQRNKAAKSAALTNAANGGVQAPMPPPAPAPSGDGPDAVSAEPDSFGGGTIVTRPTIAKLAEKGIPEAVVPLNPNAGSHVRPDLLEGEIKPPQLPGMRYRQYKGFSKLSY